MNDYVGQLEQALSEAARREHGNRAGSHVPKLEPALGGRDAGSRARGGLWRSLRRWPGVAVAAGLLALAATAAAAVGLLDDRGSAPLTGTVPSLPLLRYRVPVTPDLEAGNAGWCSYPSFATGSVPPPDSGSGACAPAYGPGAPIVIAGGEPISNGEHLPKRSHTPPRAQQGGTYLFWAIVISRVAALRLSPGLVVTARREDGLPPGWRAVVAFVSGRVDPVALDSSGVVIPEGHTAPQTTRAATGAYEPGSSAALSPCSIRIPRLPYVTASWGVVATRVPTLGTAVEASVLFSCARSWYSIKGSTAAPSAAILLGARNPTGPAPVLPGLTATTHPGVFSEDGGASGPILARRVGRGWLVVQGPSISTDARLLSALRAEGAAVTPSGHR